jgi:hypothetical protein
MNTHLIERTVVQERRGRWLCLETGTSYSSARRAFDALTADAASMVRPRGVQEAAGVLITWLPSTDAGSAAVGRLK